MAVRILFDPQPKGVRLFSDAERDNTYLEARPFFFNQVMILLEEGWKNHCNSEVHLSVTKRSSTHSFIITHNQFLFDISKGETKKGRLRRIILPYTFADFLDISKANIWREMFENPVIFNPIKKGKKRNFDLYIRSSAPLSNIFYFLQVLAPGMLVIYHEYKLHDADIKVSKLLPQASWVEGNINFMSKTDALITAARDPKIAFHEEKTARPQNNSHPSSLPGTDAVPSSSLPGMDAVPSSSSPGTDTLNSTSSLPGTNTLPKIAPDHKTVFVKEGTSTLAKDQKAASKKKKKPRRGVRLEILYKFLTFVINFSFQTNFAGGNNSSYTVPRYQKPEYYSTMNGDGYDWGMCDKDCAWCGRCSSEYSGDFME